jgi:hypothetical protein
MFVYLYIMWMEIKNNKKIKKKLNQSKVTKFLSTNRVTKILL